MKKNIWMVLFLLFMVAMQKQLFSTICSRIEGEVLDRDTSAPIAGAWVVLFVETESGGLINELGHTQQTDSAGKFIFHNQKKGCFAVVVIKNGYAAYGRFMKVFFSLPKEVQHEIINPNLKFEYAERNPNPDGAPVYGLEDLDHFALKEGQVKHLKIKLDKEAVLQINVAKKTLKETKIVDDKTGISVTYSNSNDDIDYGFRTINGKYRTRYLHAGEMEVEIDVEGYPDKKYHVILEKGKTVTIDLVADFTVGMVIHGVVISKSSRKPFRGVSVFIEGEGSVVTDDNGEYYIGFISKSGNYKIDFSFGSNRILAKHIEIYENEIKEINIEL